MKLAIIGEDGWISASEPPDNDRFVEIAWDDGSHSDSFLGFYDGIAEIPDSGKRWWWQWSEKWGMHRLPHGSVLAWRERNDK